MKPENALKQLHLVADGARSFDKDEVKKLMGYVSAHVKMLERDNGRLRGKIRRKRTALKNREGERDIETK